jgi:DNA-binding transcriptional ArsR family regulator
MSSTPSIAEIGALLGNPGRANVLSALLSGRALTASELAYAAHVSPQTTSGYLTQLTEARLLVRERQGRHSYFRLASAGVARMLEGILAVASEGGPPSHHQWRGNEALRAARTCYDHLAGRLGVAVADALVARGRIVLADDGGRVTTKGQRFLTEFGISLAGIERGRRAFCRPCLDWSERRAHIAGSLGAALALRCFELGWIERQRDSRAVAISRIGRRGFSEVFGIAAL